MRPVRPSAAEMAELCGHSEFLGRKHAEGSIHSKAGTDAHTVVLGHLRDGTTPDQEAWRVGLDIIRQRVPGARWEIEVPMKLVDPDDGTVLAEGTADAVANVAGGGLVIDYKNGQRPVTHPDENLQVLCYALGIALERDWSWFELAIWQPLVWGLVWSRRFERKDYSSIVARYRKICEMPETPIVGEHCSRCYRTSHCEAYQLPVIHRNTELEPLTMPGGLTTRNFAAALRTVEAMEELADRAKRVLKAFASEHGGVDLGDGVTYGPVVVKGRESISLERVKDAGLYDTLNAAGCINRAAPHEAFRRIKSKSTKK